ELSEINPVSNKIRDPVRLETLRPDPECSVSVPRCPGEPRPAFIGPTLNDLGPKAVQVLLRKSRNRFRLVVRHLVLLSRTGSSGAGFDLLSNSSPVFIVT